MDVIDGEERRLSEQRERQGGGGGSGPALLVLTLWRWVFQQVVRMGSAVETIWERLWAGASWLHLSGFPILPVLPCGCTQACRRHMQTPHNIQRHQHPDQKESCMALDAPY